MTESENGFWDFEIPTKLYDQIEELCKKLDMSVTQFVEEAILRGIGDPSTLIS